MTLPSYMRQIHETNSVLLISACFMQLRQGFKLGLSTEVVISEGAYDRIEKSFEMNHNK